MPIRKRGDTWQVDVRTAEGTRIRRSFPTQESAIEAEAAMKPNPQQRAAMRHLRREQSARSTSTHASGKASRQTVATFPPPASQPHKLPPYAQPGNNTRLDTGKRSKATSGPVSE